MVDRLADFHMADIRPSPGLRAVVRVLLVLAFAVLILGFLISGVSHITDSLIQNTINDVTNPDALNNTTTTSNTIIAPNPPQTMAQSLDTGPYSLSSAARPTLNRVPEQG